MGNQAVQGHEIHLTIKRQMTVWSQKERGRENDTVTKSDRCWEERGHYLGNGDRTNDTERDIPSLENTNTYPNTHGRNERSLALCSAPLRCESFRCAQTRMHAHTDTLISQCIIHKKSLLLSLESAFDSLKWSVGTVRSSLSSRPLPKGWLN